MSKTEAMDYYTDETPTARTIRMVMEEAAARERERCAKIAEAGIADMMAQHASWRDGLGKDCAQPYDDEIMVRREIAAAIRNVKG